MGTVARMTRVRAAAMVQLANFRFPIQRPSSFYWVISNFETGSCNIQAGKSLRHSANFEHDCWRNPIGFLFKVEFGHFSNERRFSVEFSLQSIWSNSFLCKWNNSSVVIQTWSWRGKYGMRQALEHYDGCRKQTVSASILFFKRIC